MPNTPRWSLPYPKTDNSESPTGPADFEVLALALDNVAMDDQGILSAMPSPGKKGRYWWVKGDPTPANNGLLFRDDGTNWDVIGANTIVDVFANLPAATAVPAGTRFIATDQVTERLSDGTNWIRLGSQAGDLIPTLNTSARDGRILLAGQAWPETTGIYAELYALWGADYPTDLPDLRGRGLITLGTHEDIDTIGNNEGSAVANRRPAHPHSFDLTVPSYPGSAGSGDPVLQATVVEAPSTTAVSGTVGAAGTANDSHAYFVGNVEAKL